MVVNHQELTGFTLWAHTSPSQVEVTIDARKRCELQIWNVWMFDGIVQAWVGQAGIRVHSSGNLTRLECSGGGREVDFQKLVVEIEVGSSR